MTLFPSLNRRLINKESLPNQQTEKRKTYLPFTGNRGDRVIEVPDTEEDNILNQEKVRELVRQNQGLSPSTEKR